MNTNLRKNVFYARNSLLFRIATERRKNYVNAPAIPARETLFNYLSLLVDNHQYAGALTLLEEAEKLLTGVPFSSLREDVRACVQAEERLSDYNVEYALRCIRAVCERTTKNES